MYLPRPYQIYYPADNSEFVIIEMHNPEFNKYVTMIHNQETGWLMPNNDHLTKKEFKQAGSTW